MGLAGASGYPSCPRSASGPPISSSVGGFLVSGERKLVRERRPNRGPTLSPLLSPSTSHSCIPTSSPPLSEAKTISISDRLFLSLLAAESRPIRGRERQTAVRFDPRRSGEPHLGFPLTLGVRGRRDGAARVLFADGRRAQCVRVAGRAREDM